MHSTLTFLGTGTSMGVPTLGCPCAVCRSAVSPDGDHRNRRTRPSIRLDFNGHTVLIDTGPDFHAQAIREDLRHVDAVFYTHGHADHILGLDDLRPLSFLLPGPLPLYADDATADVLERVFSYTFHPASRYATSARVQLHRISDAPNTEVSLFGARFQRIPVQHGKQRITGYRFGSAAYLTDMSEIPPESLPLLQNLDLLILDALRRDPHPTHSNLENSIRVVELLKPRRALFTHMSHDLDHGPIEAILPPHIRLAYDGLKVEFDIAPQPEQPTMSQLPPQIVTVPTESAPSPHPMAIYRSLAELPPDLGPVVATIGNFDGVHRGHRWVIAEVIARAKALGIRSLAVTFDPHPAHVLRPGNAMPLITPLAEKLRLLAATGLDATLVLPFDDDLRHLSARDFADQVLHRALHAVEVHEGENFRFGYQAQVGIDGPDGLEQLGRSLGFSCCVYTPRTLRGHVVSSSRVRDLIATGDVRHARALLGRPFAILSTPASGRGYGTRYTVPTINLAPYAELVPAHGVYITTLTIGEGHAAETFESVTNVGNRPTFGADSFSIESHLLNFHPIELTEQTPLELAFLDRIRPEIRFPSTEALLEQIGRDVTRARRYFALCRSLSTR